jgi:hypothetical protein
VHGRIWQKVVGGDVYMEEYGKRLLAEMCAWKNMEDGRWLSCTHGRI